MNDLVRSDRAGAITTITLDSPANRNALSSGAADASCARP